MAVMFVLGRQARCGAFGRKMLNGMGRDGGKQRRNTDKILGDAITQRVALGGFDDPGILHRTER